MAAAKTPFHLPGLAEIRRAIGVYLGHAYAGDPPPTVCSLLPGDGAEIVQWLMSDAVERDPPGAPLVDVRSFALRLGNDQYPHMKLRFARPPRDPVFLFSVDSHDAFLHADPGSPDHVLLEEMKRHNAAVCAAINADWDRQGIRTERNYLREKIRQARSSRSPRTPGHRGRCPDDSSSSP